jgi:hypothetical protein
LKSVEGVEVGLQLACVAALTMLAIENREILLQLELLQYYYKSKWRGSG